MASPSKSQTLTVEGHLIKLSNLDKVLYPETGTTKRDVLEYLAAVSGPLITHASGRPVTRKRWVDGVGSRDEPGKVFFQKNLDRSAPDWVRRFDITHSDHTNAYPVVDDLATLVWFGQIAALELHVPQWQFGPRGGSRKPDRLVLDLDPGPDVALADCAAVARLCREILADLGLDPVPVTSGSKGIHLYAPLDGEHTSPQASTLAKELARSLEADHPDLVISSMRRSERKGKVFIDWSQNNANKTTIAPYSLRGRTRPTVAAPRTWPELDEADLAQLEYREVMRRVAEEPDPLDALAPAELPEDADRVDQRDRLDLYRSKRDPGRTPEPVPDAIPDEPDERSFVIQEHHARALHWDFRLERDGVLVSWALPKGVPTDPRKNRLAVQTEDHPLDYGTFEGEIPAGEYGGGSVSIWDAGEYQLEKWRDGEEVIATLHGRPNGGLAGPAKFALIHTGSGGERNWLIHRMDLPDDPRADDPPAEGASIETAGDYTPMLATLGTTADVGDAADWAFEMKWDGLRVLAHVGAGGVRLVSRNGNDLTESYPELSALPQFLDGGSAVLDGEIVTLRDGRPDFGLLQTRMKLTREADVERARRSTPVEFLVFDLLERNGRSLLNTAWAARRKLLEETVRSGGPRDAVQVPAVVDSDLRAAIDTSAELGLEGVVAKTRAGRYQQGRRGRTWIKIKHHRAQEVIVIGWREGRSGRAGQVGSLLLAVHDAKGELRYVGKVGTGFRSADLDEIASRLGRLERRTSPAEVPRADAKDAHWVTPSQVAEVEFAEWTDQGRLRQPSWRGWRPDKDPDHVVRAD
ncbi:MAG: ATP-dependent DNA ligase [Propionibacteriaceae bacterium]